MTALERRSGDRAQRNNDGDKVWRYPKWIVDERTGPAERRVASYRDEIERAVGPGPWPQWAHDFLAALRRPKVTEAELAEAIRPCLDDLDDGQTKEDFLMAVAEDCARVAVEKLNCEGLWVIRDAAKGKS